MPLTLTRLIVNCICHKSNPANCLKGLIWSDLVGFSQQYLGRVERRRGGGQVNGFPSCQPFRAAWQNGHQTVHSVDSAPAKIPYGGFSPVRLQTGCQPRPSLLAQLIRGHRRDLPGERLIRSRVSPAALTVSDTTHPSSGPWLRQRLFCPPASSLTMATSELLRVPPGLCAYDRRARPAEGPHFYRPEFVDVPPSLLRCLQ